MYKIWVRMEGLTWLFLHKKHTRKIIFLQKIHAQTYTRNVYVCLARQTFRHHMPIYSQIDTHKSSRRSIAKNNSKVKISGWDSPIFFSGRKIFHYNSKIILKINNDGSVDQLRMSLSLSVYDCECVYVCGCVGGLCVYVCVCVLESLSLYVCEGVCVWH